MFGFRLPSMIIVVVLFSLIYPTPGDCYRMLIDAYQEECFFDRVAVDTKIGITYEVVEGGFLDIDLKVTDPNGEILVHKERESNGRIVIAAQKAGMYKYCFSNQMSTVTPKEIMFSIYVGDTAPMHASDFNEYTSEERDEIQPEKLQTRLNELTPAIRSIKHEQEYMEVRDRIHRRINESTNFRVTVWVIFEALLVVGVTVSQVMYIKRFFEVRRIV